MAPCVKVACISNGKEGCSERVSGDSERGEAVGGADRKRTRLSIVPRVRIRLRNTSTLPMPCIMIKIYESYYHNIRFLTAHIRIYA